MATLRRERAVLLAGFVGAITGLCVAGFEWITVEVSLDRVLDAVPSVQAVVLVAGVIATAVILRAGGGVSSSTADEYIRTFHDGGTLRLRDLPVRMAAAVAGLGLGLPMGLEGPSIYAGATVGSNVQGRLRRLFADSDHRALMVAGAAAGVAAIFRAPATGAVFALEVPYRDDLGRRLLLPALVGAATGYLLFAAIHGTAPLFRVEGHEGFTFRDLVGAIVLGVGAGVLTRGFAYLLRRAKYIAVNVALVHRIVVGTGVLLALLLISRLVYGQSLTISPGYNAIGWAGDASHSLRLVALLLVLRCVATSTAVAAGGVGGLFIPLVVAGALLGRLVGGAFSTLDESLYTVLGVSAVLGAGYRVPLAAVTFVAEVAGRPQYIVPGLLAAVAADLAMAESSVTSYQRR